MAVPTRIRLEIALLVELDSGFLVLGDDPAGHRFPGGLTEPRESSPDAAERHLRAILPEQGPGPAGYGAGAHRLEFAGCVEHGEPHGPGEHTLTVLYAVTLDPAGFPAGRALPPGLTLLRPYGAGSGPVLPLAVQPPAVSRAALTWWSQRWPSWQGLPVPGAEPWWAALRQSVRTLRAQLSHRRDDLRGEDFRDSAVAMCALVAAADGRIDQRERDAMLIAVHAEDVLTPYPPQELERLFDAHLARLRADLAGGRRAALREIGKVRGDATRSWAVLRIGAVIGRADGYFDPTERRVVQDAADALGLSAGALAVQAVDR